MNASLKRISEIKFHPGAESTLIPFALGNGRFGAIKIKNTNCTITEFSIPYLEEDWNPDYDNSDIGKANLEFLTIPIEEMEKLIAEADSESLTTDNQ